MLQVAAIISCTDIVNARRAAALDLILQTGAGAVSKDAVLAVTDTKDLLHQRQAFADSAAAGVGTQITSVCVPPACALVLEGGVGVAVTGEDKGIGLVVTQ